MWTDDDPMPFLRVTIGARVFSADFELLGEVKALHAQWFKVGTGFLQRDYWLPSQLVLEAVPEELLVLTVTEADVDGYKLYQEPRQAA